MQTGCLADRSGFARVEGQEVMAGFVGGASIRGLDQNIS
jgi:hypothetical protein